MDLLLSNTPKLLIPRSFLCKMPIYKYLESCANCKYRHLKLTPPSIYAEKSYISHPKSCQNASFPGTSLVHCSYTLHITGEVCSVLGCLGKFNENVCYLPSLKLCCLSVSHLNRAQKAKEMPMKYLITLLHRQPNMEGARLCTASTAHSREELVLQTAWNLNSQKTWIFHSTGRELTQKD